MGFSDVLLAVLGFACWKKVKKFPQMVTLHREKNTQKKRSIATNFEI